MLSGSRRTREEKINFEAAGRLSRQFPSSTFTSSILNIVCCSVFLWAIGNVSGSLSGEIT
jgi:hypothetical protein